MQPEAYPPTPVGFPDHAGYRPAWMRLALCAQTDPDLWFPTWPANAAMIAPAIATCRQCDVRPECLAYALANNERHGIWGGLTERQRRRAAVSGLPDARNRLSPAAVRSIRSRWAAGEASQTALAREHGVARSTIAGVVRYDTYPEVA